VLAFAVTPAQETAPLRAGSAYNAIGRYDQLPWVLLLAQLSGVVDGADLPEASTQLVPKRPSNLTIPLP
jgi:hypothetical protein